MGRYPDAYQIEEMFANRRFPEKFHQYLAEPVDITVTGDDEFHLAGNYQSAQDFHDNVYGRGTTNVQKDTIKLDIRRVVGGGDSSWAAVESHASGVSNQGRLYALHYVDLVRFDSKGKIAQLKEFFDTKLVHTIIEEAEGKPSEGKEGDKAKEHEKESSKD